LDGAARVPTAAGSGMVYEPFALAVSATPHTRAGLGGWAGTTSRMPFVIAKPGPILTQ